MHKNIFKLYFILFLTLSVNTVFAAKKKITSQTLSFNFQDVSKVVAIQTLADYLNINITISKKIQGAITLNFKKIPRNKAFNLLLASTNLSKYNLGNNVILVAPVDDIVKINQEKEKLNEQWHNNAPIKIKYFKLRYAKAADISNLLFKSQFYGHQKKNQSSATTAANNNSLLSDYLQNSKSSARNSFQNTQNHKNGVLSHRGNAMFDKRTNTIIVRDTKTVLNTVQHIIKELDIPLQQVLIEANIVITKDNINKEFGVNWGNTSSPGSLSVAHIQHNRQDIKLTNSFITDFGAAQGASLLNFAANNGTNNILDLTLAALEKDGKVQIVSQPKIIAANGQEALISSGTEIPYVSSTQNTVNTLFKKAVLSLTVTPQVTEYNRIMINVSVTQDAPGVISNGVQTIDTSKLNTHILTKDGNTVVLGGIFTTSEVVEESKVPFLGDIPVIGWLFKRVSRQLKKSELLIFLTPYIVK